MLFVLFKVGRDRFALEAARVVEIIPLVGIQRLNSATAGVAGVFNYHGQFVAAVDLCELILHRPAVELLSTRIIVIKRPDADGTPHLLGLIVEAATGTLRAEQKQFVKPAVNSPDRPHCGPACFDAEGVIHLLDETRLLVENLPNQLAHGSD